MSDKTKSNKKMDKPRDAFDVSEGIFQGGRLQDLHRRIPEANELLIVVVCPNSLLLSNVSPILKVGISIFG